MREEEKRRQALQVLELNDDATWHDVEQSYFRLMRLYSNQSLASYGLFRRDNRHTLLEAIGKAFLRLKQGWVSEPQEVSSPPEHRPHTHRTSRPSRQSTRRSASSTPTQWRKTH